MAKVWCVFKRELAAYLCTPLTYVVMAVFLALAGYFFSAILFALQVADLRPFFENIGYVFLLLAPVLTMRLWSEEDARGTSELLLTAPVSITQIVLGKYLAVLIIYLILLGLTLVYPGILFSLGRPDPGPILAGYLGFALMGAAFLAVGLFSSAVTCSQVIAGILGFGILLFFWFLDWLSDPALGRIGEILAALSLVGAFADFQKGVIDTRNLLLYTSFIIAFLFLTVQVVKRRAYT